MKFLHLIILSCGLFILSCGDKKASNDATETVSPEVIETLEKENVELENLEGNINSDIKEIDELLKEVENL